VLRVDRVDQREVAGIVGVEPDPDDLLRHCWPPSSTMGPSARAPSDASAPAERMKLDAQR
jgi:hypothetical protein